MLGETEVEHLHEPAGREHDVAWFEIAVNDAVGVGRGQRVGNLSGAIERDRERKRPRAQQLPQRGALDLLQDQVATPLGLFDPADARDVRVVERAQQLGLA